MSPRRTHFPPRRSGGKTYTPPSGVTLSSLIVWLDLTSQTVEENPHTRKFAPECEDGETLSYTPPV